MSNLNSCQLKAEDAFVSFLANPKQTELVIRGHAGTGKTYLVDHLLENLHKYQQAAEAMEIDLHIPREVMVTATTRKAAHVVAERLGTDPVTIHSYLGLVVANDYKTGKTFLRFSNNAKKRANVLLFIDESSFIDAELLAAIRSRVFDSKIVYLGDPFQLLPINAYSSCIFNGLIPNTRLTTVERNGGAIDKLASQFRESVQTGNFYPINLTDDTSVILLPGEKFQAHIDKTFTDPAFVPDKTAKIIAWRNSTVTQYNEYIRNDLKQVDTYTVGESYIVNSPVVINTKVIFGTDEVVRIRSIQEEVREDTNGYLMNLDNNMVFVPENQADKKALLKSLYKAGDFSKYHEIKDTWADIRPVYACTIHKSQGSTYDKVYIDLEDIGLCNSPSTVARLLYVAISRASTQVILYGSLPEKYLGKENVLELCD